MKMKQKEMKTGHLLCCRFQYMLLKKHLYKLGKLSEALLCNQMLQCGKTKL